MNKLGKKIWWYILLGVFCCLGILCLLVPRIIEGMQDIPKRLALEKEVRRRSAPGYRQKNMFRIFNHDPCDIKRLQINYDCKSFVVERFRTDQMFRHLIETSSPMNVEFIVLYEDGKEYKIVRERWFTPPDNEIILMFKRDKMDGLALGPIDPNETIGLSPVKPIVIKWWESE